MKDATQLSGSHQSLCRLLFIAAEGILLDNVH